MPFAFPANALYVVGIATVFSLVSICARLAYDAGSNALTIVTMRTLFASVLLVLLLNARRVDWKLPRHERNWALGLGAALALGTFLLNRAIQEIPVTIAILIFYTYPPLTSVLSWVTGTERFSLRVLLTVVLAFVGLALALQVKGGALDAGGLAYAVGASATWGVLMYLTGRKFRGGDSRPRTLHMMLSSATLFIVVCAATGEVAFPTTPKGWLGFAGVPFTYSIAIIGTMAAVSAIGAMKTSFYMNFEPISTIIFSALVLDQYMTPLQLFGALLVVVALSIFKLPPAAPV